MVTVSGDPVRVESQLQAGELICPSCSQGRLGPWGWARLRQVGRSASDRRGLRPRCGRCRGCGATHVLLPVFALLRRADLVEVIGRAVAARMAGKAWRPIAALVEVPRSTVRGWVSRFETVAEQLRAHFTRWALWADPALARIEPAGSAAADALAAIVAAARSVGAGSTWRFASAATGGRLLCNTSSPFPSPWPA